MDLYYLADNFQKGATEPVLWYKNALVLHRGSELLRTSAVESFSRLPRLLLSELSSSAAGGNVAQKLTAEQSAAMLDASLSVVSTLLLAASIESLLKGLILVSGEKLLEADGKLKRAFRHHRLHDYARQAGLSPLSADDIRALKRLSAFLEWQGRYPIPTDASKLLQYVHEQQGISVTRRLCLAISTQERKHRLRSDSKAEMRRRPNKSLEPTASRRIASLFMTKTRLLQAALALASGGSALSR